VPKGSLTNLIIDRALVSMLDRAVQKFTAQDVRGEAIDMGYRGTPSTDSICRRLDRHTDADLLRQVSERASSDPRVWMFSEDSDKIKDFVFKGLERWRNLGKRTLGDK
jgi:predicted NAD/FAD-dependent oxidoreductase